MPKLSSRLQESRVAEGRPETFFHVSFSGFIDAANYAAFEKTLESVYAKGGRFVVADFSELHYINSTGISALIRFYGLYKDRGGAFCLANVPKQVGLSMHLLGVTSLSPFLKDVKAAGEHFLQVLEGKSTAASPAGASLVASTGWSISVE